MSESTTELKPVYLIVSDQEFLLQHALDRLKARVAEVADIDFNYEQFDGESADADQVVSACNTLPFASDRRLVVLRNVDKMGKDGLDTLASYAENPAETAVLAMSAVKIAKNTRLFKIVDRAGGVIERKAPRGAEFQRRVISMAGERGKRLSADGAESLVRATGENLRVVTAELDKLIAYVGEREEIQREDVDQLVGESSKTKLYEFADALADRDCTRAIRVSANLLNAGESVFALHSTALRTLRDLLTARALADRGRGGLSDLAAALGKPDWMVKRLPRQARSFSAEELVDLLRSAAAGEAQMKTSRDARLVFELWIVRFCGV
jgi:DNA polymerase-3 subunit delta